LGTRFTFSFPCKAACGYVNPDVAVTKYGHERAQAIGRDLCVGMALTRSTMWGPETPSGSVWASKSIPRSGPGDALEPIAVTRHMECQRRANHPVAPPRTSCQYSSSDGTCDAGTTQQSFMSKDAPLMKVV
jgi:hypothetical protein